MEMWEVDFEKWFDSLDKPKTFDGSDYKSTCKFAWKEVIKRYFLEDALPDIIRQNAHEDFIHNGLVEHNNE